jgi:hypothetical protein
MLRWIVSQWNDVKGNAKWAFLGLAWWTVTWLSNHLVREIPNIPHWVTVIIPLALSVIAFVWLARKPIMNDGQKSNTAAQSASTALTTNPNQFGLENFYDSPLAKEVENNMRQAVDTRYPQPKGREEYLFRYIGLGVVATIYDNAWAYIFRSQILLLEELNRRSMPLGEAREFYNKAVQQTPTEYAAYSFDQWLEWL